MESKLVIGTEIGRSKKDFKMKKASYDTEVNTSKAEMAYGLQAAKVHLSFPTERRAGQGSVS